MHAYAGQTGRTERLGTGGADSVRAIAGLQARSLHGKRGPVQGSMPARRDTSSHGEADLLRDQSPVHGAPLQLLRARLATTDVSAGQEEDLPRRLHADTASALFPHSLHGLQLAAEFPPCFHLPLQLAGILLQQALCRLELPGKARELLLPSLLGAPQLPPQPVTRLLSSALGNFKLQDKTAAVLLLGSPRSIQILLQACNLLDLGPLGSLELRCQAFCGLLGRPLLILQPLGKLTPLPQAVSLHDLELPREAGDGTLPLGQGAIRKAGADGAKAVAQHLGSARGLADGPPCPCGGQGRLRGARELAQKVPAASAPLRELQIPGPLAHATGLKRGCGAPSLPQHSVGNSGRKRRPREGPQEDQTCRPARGREGGHARLRALAGAGRCACCLQRDVIVHHDPAILRGLIRLRLLPAGTLAWRLQGLRTGRGSPW
mmetsp:Transcript_38186/g.118748  ORF Transcript_38186/g.118748 Transcript_38186/m.118748 type:complete len:433 (+) Transcript_38186:53-1351(+)